MLFCARNLDEKVCLTSLFTNCHLRTRWTLVFISAGDTGWSGSSTTSWDSIVEASAETSLGRLELLLLATYGLVGAVFVRLCWQLVWVRCPLEPPLDQDENESGLESNAASFYEKLNTFVPTCVNSLGECISLSALSMGATFTFSPRVGLFFVDFRCDSMVRNSVRCLCTSTGSAFFPLNMLFYIWLRSLSADMTASSAESMLLCLW